MLSLECVFLPFLLYYTATQTKVGVPDVNKIHNQQTLGCWITRSTSQVLDRFTFHEIY